MPDEVLQNDALNSAIAVLPANYSFEVGLACAAKLVVVYSKAADSSIMGTAASHWCTDVDTQNSMEIKASQSQKSGNSVSRGAVNVLLYHC